MDIKKLSEEYDSWIIEKRREFHEHPELSFEEKWTTGHIIGELEKMGIPVETYDGVYGAIGAIKGGKGPGKTVLLRADIDALPVTEQTGLPFCSKIEGKMHACGHDAHTAMLLGAAKILVSLRDQLRGEVKLLFQSAEESCFGARSYVERGALKGVDAVFGMHVWGTLDAPFINYENGNRMASCDNFKIIIHGKSAHGSAPHQGHDAVVAAASAVMNIQTMASRFNDPLNSLVITVGTMKGGERANIISNCVEMEGTVRTFSREVRGMIEEKLRKIVEDSADALGCRATLEYDYLLDPVINEHEDLVRISRAAAVKLFGADILKDMPQLMGSEDFSMLMKEAPGVYGFIGTVNKEKGSIYSNHDNKYTVDEDVLHMGAALYAQFALDYLAETGGN
ncbi:MAG: amidohydrolase [Fusobacteriaceae bacterium]|jgi:amidohydrolase|nr:amidohydrolase [Fusobacteriaceae bacterium]